MELRYISVAILDELACEITKQIEFFETHRRLDICWYIIEILIFYSVIEQLGGKQLVMQYLSHEDPNVRFEALIAVQKLMVHNWYVYSYTPTYTVGGIYQSPSPIFCLAPSLTFVTYFSTFIIMKLIGICSETWKYVFVLCLEWLVSLQSSHFLFDYNLDLILHPVHGI